MCVLLRLTGPTNGAQVDYGFPASFIPRGLHMEGVDKAEMPAVIAAAFEDKDYETVNNVSVLCESSCGPRRDTSSPM